VPPPSSDGGSARTEKGCLSYTLYQDPFEKTSFIVVELYTNQAAINEHFGTHYFKEFGSKAGNLTVKPSEIKIYDIRERKTESFK
jgi:quinol monooxygenase YgiN